MSGQRYGKYSQPSQKEQGNLEGQLFEILGQRAATLSWEQTQGSGQIMYGGSHLNILNQFKGSIVRLWDQFFSGRNSIDLSGDHSQQLKRRLFLLEHEVEGLLKKKINYTVKGQSNLSRTLDYTGILNEKQNQIVELQKKIQNLQAKLFKARNRQNQLEAEISRLQSVIISLEKPTFNKRQIQGLFRSQREYKELQGKFNQLQNQVSSFAGLINLHMGKLKGLGQRFEYENQLRNLIAIGGVQAININGVVNLVDYRDRVVEVPIQDAQTKQVIHLLAVQMNKFFEKYPKLRDECDAKLYEFFQKELIEIIEGDSLDRVVEIVKYVPDIVRVEDVYAYSSQKSRKVEFHLRVLIKALLEQLEKLKARTGATLEIDEGIIGMIRQQIMDVVDIDDILKVFRSVPKIVEVQKIIEKVVDRVIEVPQIIPVEVIKEIPIEVVKYQEVEKIVHVPVDVTKVVDRVVEKLVPVETIKEIIVEVPKRVQVVVERVVELPKIITKEVIVEKVIEVEKPVVVEKVIHIPQPEPYPVEVIKEKTIIMDNTIEKSVPVDRIVEKVVKVLEHEQHPVEVELRNDVLVKELEVSIARQVKNVIEERTKTVTLEKEKVVPFVETHERIVEVPKVMEKIVEVRTVSPQIKQVHVEVPKIIEKQVVVEVQKIIEKPVQVIQQVIKQVEKIVEVPVFVEKIKKVPEVVTKVVVEKTQVEKPYQVVCQVQIPIEVSQVVEVEKPVIHYVHEEVPVKIKVDKVVPVTKTVQRIKQVRVNVDKVIEKMVEVPKVVEVEKIVEKVVVVPRVIEKIVEVPQIVETVVEKIVQVEKIIEVPVKTEVPLIKEKPVEIEVQKNFYITNEVPKEIVQEKMAIQRQLNETVKVQKQVVEKYIVEEKHIPKETRFDKIIPVIQEIPKIVELEKDKIVQIVDPQPVQIIQEKPVPLIQVEERIVQVVQQIEKIVEVNSENVKVEVVTEVEQVPIIQTRIQIHEDKIPYIEKRVEEVRTIQEKSVYLENWREQIKEVECIVQKIVPQVHNFQEPKEITVLEQVMVEKTKVQPVQNIIPALVETIMPVPQYRDLPIEIPLLNQQIKQVKVVDEKIVGIQHRDTQVIEVPVKEDKIVIEERLNTKTDIRNYFERLIETVEVKADKIVPVHSTIEKLVEVPHILEKIVEKIVIMPQIVEVIKYVHEIVEQENLGVAVGVDIQVQEKKYKDIHGKVKLQFEGLLAELRKLKLSNPALQAQILIIERFLADLDGLIALPRIVEVQKQVEVEVDKKVPVLVPKVDLQAQKHQVTLSLIIHKLMAELLRIKDANPALKMNLDKDIMRIFASEFKYKDLLEGKVQGFETQMNMIYNEFDDLLRALGGAQLSRDQQLIFTSAIQERLVMASLIKEANLEIDKVKKISDERNEAFKMMKQSHLDLINRFRELENANQTGNFALIADLVIGIKAMIENQGQLKIYHEPERKLEDLFIHDTHESFVRVDSAFREIAKENQLLRNLLIQAKDERPSMSGIEDRDRIIDSLEKKIAELSQELNSYKSQASVSVKVTGNTDEYQIKIRTLNSRIQELQSQLRTTKIDYESKLRNKDHRIRELEENLNRLEERAKIGDSRITEMGGTFYTPSNYSNQHMSSSIHSSSSGSERQTPSKNPASQTNVSGSRQYGYSNVTGTTGGVSKLTTGGGSIVSGGGTASYATGRNVGSSQSGSTISYGGNEGTTYVRATDSSVVTGSTSGNASYTSGTGTSSGNASYTSGTGSTSGNASYTSGTGGYQRSYGTGLNQSGSSQGSVSYGGRQYTQQSGESSEGTTTQGYRYYTSSRKDQS